MGHPLESFFGCLILVACVGMHFYALGSKSDPALLAYDEAQTWQLPASMTEPTASEVLFASHNQDLRPVATGTLSYTPSSPLSQRAAAPVATFLPAPSNLEATLLTLNFGY